MSVKVVVIDDDEDILRLMVAKLSKQGYEVLSFQNPKDGLAYYQALDQERAAKEQFLLGMDQLGILVVDYEMPDLNGVQLIKALRELKHLPGLPILVLTGSSDEEIVAEVIAAGADYFVNKMGELQHFLPQIIGFARIKSQFDLRSRQRQLEVAGTMVATIQHETGNSLAKLSASLFNLRRLVPPSEATDEYFKRAQQELMQLGEVIRCLGDYEKLSLREYAGGVRVLNVRNHVEK